MAILLLFVVFDMLLIISCTPAVLPPAWDRVFSCVCLFVCLFVCLSVSILLEKLYHYGIRGTVHQWFKNYLSSRKQFTFVNNTYSDNLGISCGVPQGSVLGLSLIHI